MAKLLPKEKLVPQKDLAELAFREKEKQEQVNIAHFWLIQRLIYSLGTSYSVIATRTLCLVKRLFILIRCLMQCSYNVIAYKDKPRLRTALEMLRTTQEIESRLEEVCGFNLLCSGWFCFYKRHLSLVQLLRSLLILTSIALLNSFVQTLNMREFALVLWVCHVASWLSEEYRQASLLQ